MDLTMLSGVAGLGAGVAAAGLAGPLACTWPARGEALMRRLNAVKVYRRPGVARTVAGGVLIAALLGAGAFTAYAAEPSAPQQLAKAVVGVVGSGDRLSLNLKEAGAAPRNLKPGDEYKDGWKLESVTPTSAILTKDGASAEVGLNPAGAVVPAVAIAQAPTSVEVVQDRPLSQSQIDLIDNERRSAQIAALRAAQPPPTPAQLAIIQQNNANVALVTAENNYIRASALMDQATGLMARAHTDDFSQVLQGPGLEEWSRAVYSLGGGLSGYETQAETLAIDAATYEKSKAIVAQGPPTMASVTQSGGAAPPANPRQQ